MPLMIFGTQHRASHMNFGNNPLLIGCFRALPWNQSEGCNYRINKFGGLDGAILVIHQDAARGVLLWFLAPSESALCGCHVLTIRQMPSNSARFIGFGDNCLLPSTLWTVCWTASCGLSGRCQHDLDQRRLQEPFELHPSR